MEYTLFGDEARVRMLQDKLRTYEMRHFEATLNAQVGAATGASPEEIAVFEKGAADFVVCIGVIKEQLGEYPAPPPKQRLPRPVPDA